MSVTSINPNATAIFAETPVRSEGLVPLTYAITGISIITVALRLYCRKFMTKNLWWDDGLIVLALLVSIGFMVDAYYGELFGWGHHAADIPPLAEYVVGVLKTLFITQLFLTLDAGLTKCSILFFYLRLTKGGAHPGLRWATIIALVFIGIWTVVMTIFVCVQCVPTSHFWDILDYAERDAACHPWAAKLPFFLGQGITNTIGDFVVVFLPSKQIWSLRLPKRQKIVVVVLFLLGILAAIAGILRLVYVVDSFSTTDTTWNGAITFSLSVIEVNVGVICASVPAIKPLVVAWFPHFSDGENPSKFSVSSSVAPTTNGQAESNGEGLAEWKDDK